MFESYDLYRIRIYSPLKALTLLKERHIPIRDFQKTADFTYEFKVAPRFKKQIVEIFSEAVLIERHGPSALSYNLLRKKTTLISLVFALVFFIFASTRIYTVNYSGGSAEIEAGLAARLEEFNIRRFSPLPSLEKIATVQKTMEKEFAADVEFLEVKKIGLTIDVKYEKRREPIVLPELSHTLVAAKDGVVQSLLVEHGQKSVAVNDYVKKGQVLVSATITLGDNKTAEIFAKGKVMAFTWNVVEVELENYGRDEAEMMAALLQEADRSSLKTAVEGSIDTRNMLEFDYGPSRSRARIHYQLIENIAVATENS